MLQAFQRQLWLVEPAYAYRAIGQYINKCDIRYVIWKCTHCLAANIILAFLSLRLASLFSALSSQTALPPISLSCTCVSADATRSCNWYLDIREGCDFVAVVFATVVRVEFWLPLAGVRGYRL